MDVLRGIRVFVACAEGGSFAAAARRLGVSGAAVSRHIAALEAHLGARLFNRSTRSLSLTEAGEQFIGRASHLLAEFDAIAGRSGVDDMQAPQGLLRVSAPLSFGLRKLGALVPGFLRRYPGIRLEIDTTDRTVDLVHEGFDVALRINPPNRPSDLIQRPIGDIRVLVCCSPDFLRRVPPLRGPGDLQGVEVLNYSYFPGENTWAFIDAQGRREAVRVVPKVLASNGDLLRDIAIGYGGVILQPAFIVEEDLASGRLVEILPGWRIEPSTLCAMYPSRRHLPAKVRVFIDYLVEQLSG